MVDDLGGDAIHVRGGVHLSDLAQGRDWVYAAVEAHDGIDTLYNIAAVQRFGALDDLRHSAWPPCA
ncbi:hypothetical protein ABT336_27330 [Micromonospora sp. NPDC000207]|uniref:hypothetical protein n=1 Tax=Micromonospora sp. NPDC000207 TaxID=3154246 RepID=UPI0033333B54